MAKELGTNMKVYVGDANPATAFTPLGGERTSGFGGSTKQISTSDKNNQDWDTYIAGLKGAIIDVSGQCDWPDTDGLAAIQAAWENKTPLEYYIRLNINGDGYRGVYDVTNFRTDGDAENVTEYTVQLSPRAALTRVTAVPAEVV